MPIAKGRFKRSLFGYGPAEVDAAMDAAEVTIASQGAQLEACARRNGELERVADLLSERVVERDRDLRRLRAELAERDDGVAAISALMGELEEVRRTARGQATRIRLGALREAAALSERIGELTERPVEMRERLLEALAEAVARIGDEEAVEAATATEGRMNGHREVEGDLFEGMIEVEIGPLADFSQLVGFEDAAKSIAATSGISVKRFSEGRATLEMSLKEPVALLQELEERCDLELVVRDTRNDRVVLDVGP